MKAKDIKCKICGGAPGIHGINDIEGYVNNGPYTIICSKCGEKTVYWKYPVEAWAQWRYDNYESI